MFTMCGLRFILSTITGCGVPQQKWTSSNDKDEKGESVERKSIEVKSIEGELLIACPKISQPHENLVSNDDLNICDRRRNFINSNDAKQVTEVVQEAMPILSEEAQIVPVIPTHNQRSSLQSDSGNSGKSVNDQICTNQDRIKKPRSFKKTLKNMTKMKKASFCSRSEKNMTFQRGDTSKSYHESPAAGGLNMPRAQSTILQRSNVGVSAKETSLNATGESRNETYETWGTTPRVSMMTTVENVIISIKFPRQWNNNKETHVETKSQKQAGTSKVVIPSIHVTDYSINETSYRQLPNIRRNASNCTLRRRSRTPQKI